MVPAEGFEPPTYGLQNRCTTTVLSRHREVIDGSIESGRRFYPIAARPLTPPEHIATWARRCRSALPMHRHPQIDPPNVGLGIEVF